MPHPDSTPHYSKKVNDLLTISLTYLADRVENSRRERECVIELHNTSDRSIVVNPETQPKEEAGWFGSIFGGSEPESESSKLINPSGGNDIKVLLGYVQIVGYVVLNYNFVLGNATNTLAGGSKNSLWWDNRDYINQYEDDGDEDEEEEDTEDIKELKMNNVPFISENLAHPMIVGGRLGGVADLVMERAKHNITLEQKYFLHDLLYTFNSHRPPKSEADHHEPQESLPLSDITDSIVPFYTTSQALLFSDISIKPGSSRKFRIRFPQNPDLPPTYNARSTGLARDQGWISIRYSLIVGLSSSADLSRLVPHTVYFPLTVKGERLACSNKRWLQKDYLSNGALVDKKWNIITETTPDVISTSIPDLNGTDSRAALLSDLSKLIESDLYNMPKVSSSEHRNSIGSQSEPEVHDSVPQLPEHLKTQYQLRVNNVHLCLISLSHPYYHVGQDINFTLDINPEDHSRWTKIAGAIVYLEAHEVFHATNNTNKSGDFTNVYPCTPKYKVNTLAASLWNSQSESGTSLVNGTIHIPRYLTQQFQSSKLMSLKYYLLFKFNLCELNKDERESQNHNQNHEHNDQTETLLQDPVPHAGLKQILDYRFDTAATELKFKLPLALLP